MQSVGSGCGQALWSKHGGSEYSGLSIGQQHLDPHESCRVGQNPTSVGEFDQGRGLVMKFNAFGHLHHETPAALDVPLHKPLAYLRKWIRSDRDHILP